MSAVEQPETTNMQQLGALIKELTSVVMQRSSGEMLCIMSEIGLSLPQLMTLHRLEVGGSHSISAIAAHLNLSLAATSHLVDRMVNHGLVARSEDINDRRHKSVTITPAGRVVIDRLFQARVRDIDRAVAVLPLDLREELQRALAHIVEALKSAPMPQQERSASKCYPRKKST